MLPGPTQVLKCPFTGKGIYHPTTMSGNTFGAVLWSDGKLVAPMMYEEPLFVRSPHVDDCFWIEDAEVYGEQNELDDNPNPWPEGKEEVTADEVDIFKYLSANPELSEERALHLRLTAWWVANDRYRENNELAWERSERQRESMLSLVALLPQDDPSSCLMKVEIFRQLGLFDEARKFLNDASLELEGPATFFREFLQTRDCRLRRFPEPETL